MNGKKLFGASNEMKQFKGAVRSAPAFSSDNASASIVSVIYWTVTVRC